MKLYQDFFKLIDETPLIDVATELQQKVDYAFNQRNNGNLQRWREAYANLPDVQTKHIRLDTSHVSIGKQTDMTLQQQEQILQQLKILKPWRKGPYKLFDIDIDTEWRSDWKWDRLTPHIAPLKNKLVLDVGCGSGYHSWRMAGEGAKLVMGIDPSLLFVMQYQAVKKYAPNVPVFVFPFSLEEMPKNIPCFDSVFSMGVLYHRRSPIDHLLSLQNLLKPNGELVLETLIIEGGENQVLVPRDRYAKMRNVWFIPSVPELIKWVQRCGFKNVRCVDMNQTSIKEQRSTPWMNFESLADFLNPDNPDFTTENYPAPRRAIIIANK